MLRRLAANVPLRLALIAFVVYNANLRSRTSHDTYPARLLPVSILTEFDLDLDEFTFLQRPELVSSVRGSDSTIPYFIQARRGHWVSSYPVMPAILAAPVYAVPVLLGLHEGPPLAPDLTRIEVVTTLLSKIAGSLAAALSVALVYLTLLRFATPRGALALSLIYAFATSTWSVTSQGLWQTSFCQPLLALALYAVVRAREATSAPWFATAGLALGLSVACRPQMVFIAAAITVYVFWRHPKSALQFAIAPALIGAALLAYNLYYFDSVIGGYSAVMGVSDGISGFSKWDGIRGLLVSPSRGILVYSPVLIPAFAGIVLAFARRPAFRDALFTCVAAGIVISIAQYAVVSGVWHGGFGYSYRFLAELLPAFMLMLAPVWAWCVSTAPRRVLMTAAFAYSVGIQIVGAFYYPCDWFQSPPVVEDPAYNARFFSWSQWEVPQCIKAGPADPEGLQAIRRVLGLGS
jgi:hypothetical protein